jgi:hypothetical protein
MQLQVTPLLLLLLLLVLLVAISHVQLSVSSLLLAWKAR